MSPGSLAGLRMATRDKRFQRFGADTITLPHSEVYYALQTGAVEAVEASLAKVEPLIEVIPEVTFTNHRFIGWVIVCDRERWQRLNTEAAHTIQSILREAGRNLAQNQLRAEQRRYQEFQENPNVALRLLSEEDRRNWRQAAEPLNRQVAEESGPFYSELIREGFESPRDEAPVASIEPPKGMVVVDGPGTTPPTPTSGKPISISISPRIYWNGWCETLTREDVQHLVVDHRYRFNLDLSRYVYRERMSRTAASTISERLEREGQISLLLRPVLVGGNLVAPQDMPLKPKLMTIARDRLQPVPNETDEVNAFRSGNRTIAEFARTVNLGPSISWDVVAREAGCGTITVSVWDSAGIRPLDHLIFSLSVAETEDAATTPDCAQTDKHSIRSGLLALLLDPAVSRQDTQPLADAALHIYETRGPERTFSMAVFINRDHYLKARKDLSVSDSGIYAWQLQSALSDYVSDHGQMLDTIRHAHQTLRNDPDAPYPFAEVANELAIKIFSGDSTSDETEARLALNSLRSLLELREDPVFLVQLISAGGEMIYLPLGLIAARAAQPVVPRPFQIVQPMPYEVPPADQPCFGRWTVAIPPRLPEARGAGSRLINIDRDRAPWMTEWVETHADLIRFFDYRPAIDVAGNSGLGLILLAHHDGSYLWFNREEQPSRISLEQIRRPFPPGSVALIVACSASGAAPRSRAIVKKLNKLGIDAMIISSLPVDAEFGTHLAIEFLAEVRQCCTDHDPVSLMQILNTVIDRTAMCFPNNPEGFREMALEFQVVGQYDLTLCPNP